MAEQLEQYYLSGTNNTLQSSISPDSLGTAQSIPEMETATPSSASQPLYVKEQSAREIIKSEMTHFDQTVNVVNGYLQSGNFLTGSAGWQIKSNGDAEFNDGVFRGAITASTIDIGGSDSTSFHVDVDGNMWLGAATFGTAPFSVSNTGNVTASSITITGGTISESVKVTSNAYVAGESVVAGNALCVVNDFRQHDPQNTQSFGSLTTNARFATKFTASATITSTTVKAVIAKVAAPVDNLTIEIQTDSAGSPSGTPVTNGTSNTIGGGTVNTYAEMHTFTFGSAFTLTSGTTYWVVFKRSGAADAVNYYTLYGTNTGNQYAGFSGKVYDSGGASWSAGMAPFYTIVVATGSESIRVWKATGSSIGLSSFAGISQGAYSAAATVTMVTSGTDANQSGLSIGTSYFMGTSGAITSTASTYGGSIGQATSATQLLVEPVKKATKFLQISSGASASSFQYSGFRPKLINVHSAASGSSAIGTSHGSVSEGDVNENVYASLANGGANTNGNSSTKCSSVYFGATLNNETNGIILDHGVMMTNIVTVSSGVQLNLEFNG